MQVVLNVKGSFRTARSGHNMEVVALYRWPLEQSRLYCNCTLPPLIVIGASLSEPHMISQTVIVSVCLSVHRTFTFRIYARSNLTQMCNISLMQSDSTSRVQVHSQYSTAR